MAEPKAYDGSIVVVHVVKKGESLSKIANHYGLPNWQAIWFYNTKVRQVYMGENPDIIRPGERLFIPRSPESYDKLIKKLQLLKVHVASGGDQESYSLEANRNLYKAETVKFDFLGDALTTVATFGLKAAEVAKATRVAEQATGQAKVAAQYLADREAEKLAKMVRDNLKDTVKDAVAKKLDANREVKTGKESTLYESANKTYSTGKKALGAIAGYSMIAGKSLLDVSEIALSFLSVSKVANAYLWLSTGETVEGTMDRMDEMIKKTVERSIKQLDDKIARIADERESVYPVGGSFVGKYLVFPPMQITVARPR